MSGKKQKSTAGSEAKQFKNHSKRFQELMQRTKPIDRYFFFTVEEAEFLAREDFITFSSEFQDDAEFVEYYTLGWGYPDLRDPETFMLYHQDYNKTLDKLMANLPDNVSIEIYDTTGDTPVLANKKP